MKLIVQPEDGILPLLKAIRRANTSIDLVIFRFDSRELEKALESAVTRGVAVRALIAHTARGGEKGLRKLEQRLLEAGVTVARTAGDLPRYHGKVLVTDDTLHVLGFNFTKLDIERSRSFGIATRDAKLVKEALALFEADRMRQPYIPSLDRLVVSPESSRAVLAAFIKAARSQLLIYDAKLSDRLMIRLLQERAKAGVEVRVIGKAGKGLAGADVLKLGNRRLHVRAIIRDGRSAFVGSQSLRRLELDGRREVGLIVTNSKIARQMREVFEADWAKSGGAAVREHAERTRDLAVGA
ncbi:MAG TPA: phospholipase D-like domain-containing protein [Vicinamibacterales bacterium]|nr:phospholipase D-like domain-containing protein [Vicinamibacterales bacterium]